jgi:hypothetical protein
MAHYAFLNTHIEKIDEETEIITYTVSKVITGVSEIRYEKGDESYLLAELKVLEDSKQGKEGEELIAIENEITEYLTQLDDIPKVEVDDTVYWEGYYGKGGLCKRTSYNTVGGVHQNGGTPFRKNYAGVGYTYDPVRDAFYSPQPFESWTLNEDTCLWECPVEKPEGEYWWKEDTQEWVDYLYLSQPYNSVAPYPSWSWSTETGWTAPVEKVEGKDYWCEGEQEWSTSKPPSHKPYSSWIIVDKDISPEVFQDGTTIYSDWGAPVDYPNDGKSYIWDEETVNWIEKE